MILAGDIGGTKVDLACYDPAQGPRRPLAERTIRTADYAELATPLCEFVQAQCGEVVRCVLGAAGPIVGGRAVGVNVPWQVDQAQLSQALGMPVALLNDLQAVAHAVPFLEDDDLATLHAGRPDPHGAKAVIAPGTGLGEAYLTWDGARFQPHPSEGGHADFAPTDALQARLLLHLLGASGHVSYERVCSGSGMSNLYAFLRDGEGLEEPDWLAQALAGCADPTPIIVQAGLDAARPCPICQQAIALFVRILGAEAGNLGLRYVATGGVYIGGGLPAHLMPALTDGRLLETFLEKGRLRFLVEEIPLYVITRPKVGLLGAACAALQAASA
jgi:glucokinase